MTVKLNAAGYEALRCVPLSGSPSFTSGRQAQGRNGTQTNAMQYLTPDSTFWQLEPGENIVTYSAPSGSVKVTIEYASRYTGV